MQSAFIFVILASLHYQICSATMAKQAGPVGQLDIHNLGICSYKNNLGTAAFIDITKKGNDKFVFGNFSIPFNFDESFKFKLVMHKWTGSEWKKNVYKMDGPLCESGKKYIDVIWKKIFAQCITPKVGTTCAMKKGTYKVEKCQALSKDIKLPSIFYGKLKIEIMIYKGKDEVLCIHGEGESKQP